MADMIDPGPPRLSPPVAVTDPVSAGYTELRRRIRAEGLMDRRPRYYAIKFGQVAFLAVQQGLFGLYLGCAFAPNHSEVLRHLHAAGQ